MSQTVTVREVNQHTSAVLARVRAGEELVVTASGEPLARLVPFTPRGDYEQLFAEGKITPATTPGIELPRAYPGGADLDDILAEERAEPAGSW